MNKKKGKIGTNNKSDFEAINYNKTHNPWSAFAIYRNLDIWRFLMF